MYYRKIIICFVLIIKLVAGQVGDKCSSENGQGVCIEVRNCEMAIRSISESGSPKLPRCGFLDDTEIVCCPQTDIYEERVADKECKKIVEQYTPPSVIKVIGGTTAELGEFPHMAALAYEDFSHRFRCGGSLISVRHILTAAHCVINIDNLKPIFARLGVVNISDTSFNDATDYMIDTTITHPNYTRPKNYNDLAIIRLSKPVVTSRIVFPACLYTKNKDPTSLLEITGWGMTNVTKYTTSDVLLKGQLTIVSQNICNKSYMTSRRLTEGVISGQICAQDTGRRIDACQGDSGGPLQGYTDNDGHYRLVGVTSHGAGCATSAPGIYTRVSKYLDWIETIVWPSN